MEIALRTTERRHTVPAGYTDYRPVGSAIVCISNERMRKKWLEICGDLLAPYKRHMFHKFKYYNEIVPLWRVEWERSYSGYVRGVKTLDEAWSEVVAGSELETAMPLEPANKVPALNSFIWSNEERQRYFIVTINETTISQDQLGKLGRRTLSKKPSVDPIVDRTVTIFSDPHERVTPGWIMPQIQIDFKRDMGMSVTSLNKIDNPSTIVHPRFDLPVSASLLRSVKAPL